MNLATSHRVTDKRRRQRLTTSEAAHQLRDIASRHDHGDEVISSVVEIAADLVGALGVVFLPRDASNELHLSPEYFSSPHMQHLRSLLQDVTRLATVASAEESAQAGASDGEEGVIVVAVPVFGSCHGTEALAAAISVDSEVQARTSAAYLKLVLTWVAAFLGTLRTPAPRKNAQATDHLISLTKTLTEAAKQDSFGKSCHFIAGWVRAETRSTVVAIGVRGGWQQQCQLIAQSSGVDSDARSDTVNCLRELMEETIIADMASEGELDESLLQTSTPGQLRRLCGLNVTHQFPLRDVHGSTFGAILCLSSEAENERRVQPLSSLAQSSLGHHLSLMKAAQRHPLLRKLGSIHSCTKWYRHPLVWSTLGAIVMLMMVPLPMTLKCPCKVQPQERRFIPVPYEGRLQEALTEPGEVVHVGQLLARMDDREVTWEISKLKADLRHAEKDRDSALATFDTSASQLAGLQVERLQLQIKELQARLGQLEIRSPIEGIVIGGDPRKLQGARLSMGETLLEIGPLEKMVVELEIPDEDISYVEPTQVVRYRLNAFPSRSFEGAVDLIRPQSELRDDANVFVAETEIDNAELSIRPGMRGKARIRAGRHPLAWNLFRKPWGNLMTWLVW